MSDSKRSDFPCPSIIGSRSRSTAQTRETKRISDGFERKLDRETTPKAREINQRNNEYLAGKRRNMTKTTRKPT